MLADMGRDDWRKALEIGENEIPSALILRGTRNLKVRLAQHRALLEDAREISSVNGIFEDILLGTYQGTRLAMACVYGSAMASEVTHAFCALGISKVILTGCCGALIPAVSAGDIVIPQAAFPGDGASQYYGTQDSEAVPAEAKLHQQAKEVLLRTGWKVHAGQIYTTCALCAESSADITNWAAAGNIAVDMETATVYAVASHFGVPAVALLFAFDCLAIGENILLTDDEKTERRLQGEQLMISAALALACGNQLRDKKD